MNHKSALLWGVGVWAFAFLVAMMIFPLHQPERPLFEAIMPVAISLAVVFASVTYFAREKKAGFGTGLCLGLVWMGVSLGLDLLLFSWGPMKMSFIDYLKDIGVTYLMLPVITAGFGIAYAKK